MNLNHLSLEEVFLLRAAALTAIRSHSEAANHIAAAIADVDVALQQSIDCRSIDEQQTLLTAARTLAELLEGGVAA